MQYEFTDDDLERLAQLAHCQADTLAEEGRVLESYAPASLAAKLDGALAVARQERGRRALLLV